LELATKQVSDAIREAGKISLFNSFRLGLKVEFFRASCDKVFQRGFDIAISDDSGVCVRQKKEFKRKNNIAP
jgi:hypothetical protein